MAILSKQALKVENNASFPNNSIGAITATGLRDFNTDIIDSLVDETNYVPFSASVGTSIFNLNQFTSSQQPSFTALNAFTASQVVTNNSVDGRLNTAEADINTLDGQYTTLANWSSSINQIIFENVVIGNAQRFAFGGNSVTASIVPNVSGQVAVITINPDFSKLNTSSFNAYTASTAVTQSIFSASVANSISASANTFTIFSGSQSNFNNSATASIVQLLDFSASLDATYATDAQLNFSSSVLQSNIDTKLNTSSFNTYTQSTDNTIATLTLTSSFTSYTSSTNSRLNSLETTSASVNASIVALNISTASLNAFTSSQTDLNATLATTGSNTFKGSEIITGSLTITGSVYGNVSEISVVSQTASLDLSSANYFNITLTGSVRIRPINAQPGVTATLVINTGTAVTASFDSNVKQPSGSLYVASPSGNVDIISFTAVNSSTIYAFPAQSFV
jgi:hypothetical protein